VTQDVCICPPIKPSFSGIYFVSFSLYTWISISYLLSLMFSVDALVSCRKSTTRLCMWITQTSKLKFKMVDSQESLMEGVLVMGNGSFSQRYLTLRLVFSLNNPQNSEMEFYRNMKLTC